VERKYLNGRRNSPVPSRSASLQEQRYALFLTVSSYYISNYHACIQRRATLDIRPVPFLARIKLSNLIVNV